MSDVAYRLTTSKSKQKNKANSPGPYTFAGYDYHELLWLQPAVLLSPTGLYNNARRSLQV